VQPQRLSSAEWAAQQGPLLRDTRGVRQPRDALVHLAMAAGDWHATSSPVFA